MSYIRAMRTMILALAYISALLVTPQAALAETRQPQPSACYSIQDADARAFCLARAHRNPSMCYSVQRPDLRSMCLAEVRR